MSEVKLDLTGTDTLYRFQGGNSYPSFNIVGDDVKIDASKYTYFSKSYDHHRYFVAKRLKQLVGRIVFEEKGLTITSVRLANPDFYRKVQKEVIESPKIDGLESIEFVIDRNFLDLIEENFEYNHAKTKGSRIIERVDRRVYGGGYGIGEEWLRLFNSLTILYSKKVITRNDLLFMLNAIKCGRKSKLDSVSFLGEGTRNVIINEEIYSSFTKYTIMQELEEILDKGLYKPDSELGKHPKVMVKKITDDYSRLRDKALFELEKFEK